MLIPRWNDNILDIPGWIKYIMIYVFLYFQMELLEYLNYLCGSHVQFTLYFYLIAWFNSILLFYFFSYTKLKFPFLFTHWLFTPVRM